MHEEEAVLPVDKGESRDPIAELIGVGRGQHRREGVAAAGGDHTLPLGQEVQLVIPQHADDRVPVPVRPAQHAEGIRTPIDQVPDEPHSVPAGPEREAIQETLERAKTPLHIADDPDCHRR